jgi:hypothetical protein
MSGRTRTPCPLPCCTRTFFKTLVERRRPRLRTEHYALRNLQSTKKPLPSDMPSRAAAQIKLHITFANSKCAGEGTAPLLLIRHDNFLTLSS